MDATHQDRVIDVSGLTKVFNDFWHRPKVRAVDGISFDVSRGEVFGLLGPNGSGKSTTIKILLGLLVPSAGDARVLGMGPRSVKAKARIGYLPEESYLHRFLTARESLEFYGRLFDLRREERRQRIDALIDMVGLTQHADRPIGEFSKGMMRRVGLAQALINDPELLILDEPTSGLDPIGRRQVKDLIRALADRGKTVLLSSHLLAEVEDVCSRVCILHEGRLCAAGIVDELLKEADRMRIEFPAQDKAVLDSLLASLRSTAGEEVVAEPARRSLERFFLEAIDSANRTGAESSERLRFKGLAPFLTSGGAET